jgi:hypothetical protein
MVSTSGQGIELAFSSLSSVFSAEIRRTLMDAEQ